MSGADLIHEFSEVVAVTRYGTNKQVARLTFDADFVNLNKINMIINGTAIAEVTFALNHANTLGLLAASIALHPDVETAVVVAPRSVDISCAHAGTELVFKKILVTLGATQAVGVIASKTGGYIDGEYSTPVTSNFNIEISIQPLNGHELMKLPEGDRTREWKKGYTATKLVTADEETGAQGDRLTYGGKQYEVQECEQWSPTDLSHYKVMIAEVNAYA